MLGSSMSESTTEVSAKKVLREAPSVATPTLPYETKERKNQGDGERRRFRRYSSRSSSRSSSPGRDSDEGSTWGKFQELFVHLPLAQRGLMLAKTRDAARTSFATADSFTIGSRSISFNQLQDERPNLHKQRTLLREIEIFYRREEIGDVFRREIKRSSPSGLKQPHLNKLIGEYLGEEDVFYNPKRREEAFLPFLIKDEEKQTELYVYPWLSRNVPDFIFAGFECFVTAICMFGAGFRGECQNGTSFALIKHAIPFFKTQRVMRVFLDDGLIENYKKYVFEQLRNLAIYIQTHTSAEQPKELFCHMPYFDYILFLIELFVRGRMDLLALDDAIEMILNERDLYIDQINKICMTYGVSVYIKSPFDAIFKEVENEFEIPINDDPIFARAFLNRLDLPYEEIEEDLLSEEVQVANEKELVQKCLTLLRTTNSGSTQQVVWSDFIESTKKEISNLEDLFKMANATMVAIAARGTRDYKTLVWELLTEKQIQVSYADFARNTKYPAVINFTILDPFIIYTPRNGGNLFYQDRQPAAASQKALMKKWPIISQLATERALSVNEVKDILSTSQKDASESDLSTLASSFSAY